MGTCTLVVWKHMFQQKESWVNLTKLKGIKDLHSLLEVSPSIILTLHPIHPFLSSNIRQRSLGSASLGKYTVHLSHLLFSRHLVTLKLRWCIRRPMFKFVEITHYTFPFISFDYMKLSNLIRNVLTLRLSLVSCS